MRMELIVTFARRGDSMRAGRNRPGIAEEFVGQDRQVFDGDGQEAYASVKSRIGWGEPSFSASRKRRCR